MAFEETLKSRYVRLAPVDDWGAFWSGLRDHETKMSDVEKYLGEERPPAEFVAALLEFRERCLYVEVHHDGRVLTPPGMVNPGGLDAEQVRGWVRWLMGHIDRLVGEWETEHRSK